MKRNTRKRITYQRSIIVGFAALYLMCMLFSTYLVKENYAKSYKDDLANKLVTYRNSIYNSYFNKFDEDGNINNNFVQEITLALSSGLKDGDKYNQVSAALFGPEGKVIARTQEYFGQTHLVYKDEPNAHFYPDAMIANSPYDYFTEEEIDQLLAYMELAEKELAKGDGIITSYEHRITSNQHTGQPLHIAIETRKCKVEHIVSEAGIEYEQYEMIGEPELIWEWNNLKEDNLSSSTKEDTITVNGSMTSKYSFPYLTSGRKYYEQWKNNVFLQNFDVKELEYDGQKYYPSSKTEGNNTFGVYNITLNNESQVSMKNNKLMVESYDSDYALQIKQTAYPWYAAMDYMKYVYLYGFILMLVCIIKTIHTTNKAYRKQEELEQTRRDFTNAAAHELKTPLAIVRNILENMEREKSEEKNRYYREEAIHQTEVMDDLIQEMIFISKMDTDKIKIKSEPLSVKTMMEEQLARLETMMEEKNIRIQTWNEEDYVIFGDRSYIEKAIFNLLENAVSHNRTDGMISIHIDKGGCTIKNTGEQILEEELIRVFDMFFTGNKSRNAETNHKGLGLYLTKRIFDMHGITCKIVNTDMGVKVSF